MVEILVSGTKNRITCNHCGAILSYNIEDIREKECYISQRNTYFVRYIKCPQCNNEISLSGDDKL